MDMNWYACALTSALLLWDQSDNILQESVKDGETLVVLKLFQWTND